MLDFIKKIFTYRIYSPEVPLERVDRTVWFTKLLLYNALGEQAQATETYQRA